LSFLVLLSGDATLWTPTALLGVSFSLVPAVSWPSVARYAGPEQLGTAYGLMTMLQAAGLTLANLIAGSLNDNARASAAHAQGYAPMLWFFLLLSLAGFVFAALLWRHDLALKLHRAAQA
jgi:MFS family permease